MSNVPDYRQQKNTLWVTAAMDSTIAVGISSNPKRFLFLSVFDKTFLFGLNIFFLYIDYLQITKYTQRRKVSHRDTRNWLSYRLPSK